MKLNRIVFVVCVFGVQYSFAQKDIELGAKAGLNYSNLNLSADGKLAGTIYHSSIGYHLGGYALIKLKKKISVQPEIVYSSQGQYFTTPFYSNLKTTLNYVNIPIIFKYYPVGSLNIQLGPQFGILAGSKGDLIPIDNLGNFAGPPVFNRNLNSYMKGFDFSIAFGAGINLLANLNLSVRYNVGITDINKNSVSHATFPDGLQPSFSTAFTRNQVLQVSIGYAIRKVAKKQ